MSYEEEVHVMCHYNTLGNTEQVQGLGYRV